MQLDVSAGSGAESARIATLDPATVEYLQAQDATIPALARRAGQAKENGCGGYSGGGTGGGDPAGNISNEDFGGIKSEYSSETNVRKDIELNERQKLSECVKSYNVVTDNASFCCVFSVSLCFTPAQSQSNCGLPSRSIGR